MPRATFLGGVGDGVGGVVDHVMMTASRTLIRFPLV